MGVWNFQGWNDIADEAWHWVDTVMAEKLREWMIHLENTKEG